MDGTLSRSLSDEGPFSSSATSLVLLESEQGFAVLHFQAIGHLFFLNQFLDIVDVKAVLDVPVFLQVLDFQFRLKRDFFV